MLIQFKSW